MTRSDRDGADPTHDEFRILLLAYRLPPQGGGGVQRPAKMVREWIRDGVRVASVSASAAASAVSDETLLRAMEGVTSRSAVRDIGPWSVLRDLIMAAPTGPAGHMLTRVPAALNLLNSRLSVPDQQQGWILPAVWHGLRVGRRFRPDVVMATGPPFSAFVAAVAITRLLGVPLVLDYRDPWTANYLPGRPRGLARRLNPGLERWVLANSRGVLGAHRAIFREMQRAHPELAAKLPRHLWVPNGFDPSDFPGEVEAENDRFVLNYCGSFYDFRDPSAFLKAVGQLLESGEIEPDSFRLRIAGVRSRFTELYNSSGALGAVLEHSGYVSHEETIRRLRGSTVNLVLEGETGLRNAHSPGKVYEVLHAGRPVLLLCPEGTTTTLVRRAGGARICHPDDVDAIGRELAGLYREWREGRLGAGPEPSAIRFYDRNYQARRALRFLRATMR